MKHSADILTWLTRSGSASRLALVMAGAFTMAAASPCSAQDQSTDAATVTEAPPVPSFEYIIEDRKDPFVPFITERATTSEVNMDEIIEPKEKLTGMQLFEPGQLKLVALLKMGETDFAMVEDTTGKGYVVSEGTKIGRRGVVKDIVPNQVIIEETAETRAGKKIVSKVVMVLKKEGEE